jgi:hypothetical protein
MLQLSHVRRQEGRLFLGTELFGIGEDFLETEKDRKIGNLIKLTGVLYLCNTEKFNELLEDLDDGTFEKMWNWYTDNVTNKVKNPEVDFGKTGTINQKYSNIDSLEDDSIKKLYDGLPAIPFNNLQGFVSKTLDPNFIIALRGEGDRDDYEELTKMLNVVALGIMISSLNKDFFDKLEIMIIKRTLEGIENPEEDSQILCEYAKKYPILNNVN